MYITFISQIKHLRLQVQSLMNQVKISVYPGIHHEDAVLLTVGSFLDAQPYLQQTTCSKCKIKITRKVLERKSSQYRLSCICESCYSRSIWTSSESKDGEQPEITRRFVESMTVSGINFWQYKRYVCVSTTVN